jgi:parallel beta-helix repeat protein
VTISNNTGFAMSQDAATTLGTVSGLTATGNTTNGIEIRFSYARINVTWKSTGLPYVVTSDVLVEASSGSPVLTIEAGVTVKFNANTTLFIGFNSPGGIQAVGTSSQLITFTANTATPSAGYWGGIYLAPSATATSQIAYATVAYGGQAGVRGGVHVSSCSPTLSNLTVQNNAYSGISIAGGSPTLSALTATSNPWGLVLYGTGSPNVTGSTVSSSTVGGIYVGSPSSPSLQTVSITDNTGFAISQDAKVTLGTVSGLTATGNTTNGIEVRGSTADVSTTWKNVSLPYVVTGDVYAQGSPSTPVLTIEPGVTVKFNANTTVYVGLYYPGGIQAVGTSVSPITFTANTGSPTAGYWQGIQLLSQTTAGTQIAYATVTYGGVGGARGGIHISGSSPTIDHVRFDTNVYAGVSVNNSGSTVVNSTFVGNTAGIVNQTPAILVDARLNWWNALSGPSGSGPGGGQSVSTGVRFEPWLTGLPSSPEYFSSANAINRRFNPSSANLPSWTLAASQSSNWTFTISNSLSGVVRTVTGSGTSFAFTWDGKNGAGVDQPDGTYNYLVEANSGVPVATPAAGLTFVDRSLQVTFTAPTSGQLLSNVTASGSTDVTVTGTATMASMAGWTLGFGTGASPTSWTVIATGTQSVFGGTFGTWATLSLANGLYTLRLSASDTQGDVIQTTVTPAVGNFTASQNVYQLSAPAGNTVTFASIVPFALTETLYVKNAAGQTVRTLVNAASRAAGTYNDVWDGRGDGGQLLPDGPYFYVATASAGSSSMTWDLSNRSISDGWNERLAPTTNAFDPFNNVPLTFTYSLSQPGRVYALIAPNGGVGCSGPDRYCIIAGEYQASGSHTITWAGATGAGIYAPGPGTEPRKLTVDSFHAGFAQNAIVLFGTRPTVSGVTATRPAFSPWTATQTIAFDLTTYGAQPATVSIRFTNQASLSTLRQVSLGSPPAGHNTFLWDGRADNGMLVAPGIYLVTVTATDGIGNTSSGEILSNVQY